MQQIARQFIDNQALEAEPEPDIEDAGIGADESILCKEPSSKKRKKSSWTWEYFVATGTSKNDPARCKLCENSGDHDNAVIKRHDGSTRDMANHLRAVHQLGKGA